MDHELHLDLEPGLEVYSDTTVVYQIVPSNKLSGGTPDSLFQFKIPDYKNKYEAYKKRREHTEKAVNAMRTLFRCGSTPN